MCVYVCLGMEGAGCILLRVNSIFVWFEGAKFRGSHAIMDLVVLVPLCHRAFVGISWVQNFLLN